MMGLQRESMFSLHSSVTWSAVPWKTKSGSFHSLLLTQAYVTFEAMSAEWLSLVEKIVDKSKERREKKKMNSWKKYNLKYLKKCHPTTYLGLND